MKKIFSKWLTKILLLILVTSLFASACDKFDLHDYFEKGHGQLNQTRDFPADVALAWMRLHLELNRTSTAPLRLNGYRFMPYCAIALYESVVPGMPAFRSLSGQLVELPVMPDIDHNLSYYWPASANAALAYINRQLFLPTASDANKASMDSLEKALNDQFKLKISPEEFQRSVDFGKAVAKTVFDWSATDGSTLIIDPAYVPPVGPGLWVATPPGFGPPVGPHWGNNRLFVQGSLDGSEPAPPPGYSTDPGSDYYKMEKEVYDVSQTLTPDQIATGLFWRDAPGYGNAHFASVLTQIVAQVNPTLDIAALLFAKTGIVIEDATIGCWKVKFKYNTERPVTYIQKILGFTSWAPLFATPPHPDFPSAHSTVAGAMSETLTKMLGNHFVYTDHSYDYLNMAPRTYQSFDDLVAEMIDARVYAGIHTRNADEQGVAEGRKIASNIDRLLKFTK